MAQQEKITRKLDLGKRATIVGVRILSKTANYTVSAITDSGSYLLANNSAVNIHFTLPAVATANGHFWNFVNINTGYVKLVGATNAIVDSFGLTRDVVLMRGDEGESLKVICDGTKYYVVSQQQNSVYGYGYFNS